MSKSLIFWLVGALTLALAMLGGLLFQLVWNNIIVTHMIASRMSYGKSIVCAVLIAALANGMSFIRRLES